jgi:hypothetical protein
VRDNPTMTNSQPQAAVAARLLASDAGFCRRFAEDVMGASSEGIQALLCLANYLSLIVFESLVYLAHANSDLAPGRILEQSATIQRSRHRTKLFDDSTLGMDGVIDYFETALIPEHKSRFLGKTWLPLARRWEKDLGLTYYNNHLISTTHVTHFNLGIAPDAIGDDHRDEREAVGQDLGRYLGSISTLLDWQGPSFVRCLNGQAMRTKDVLSDEFYGSAFGGAFDPGVAAALTVLLTSLNTVDKLVGLDASEKSAEAAFKYRFIVGFHVVTALQRFLETYGSAIDSSAAISAHALLSSELGALFRRREARCLRNHLVHYSSKQNVDWPSVDTNGPLGGLADYYFPAIGFQVLSESLRSSVTDWALLIEEWCGIGG